MSNEQKKVAAGDRVERNGTVYEIVDPGGFAGTLPTAKIVAAKGETNDGVSVILTGPRRTAVTS